MTYHHDSRSEQRRGETIDETIDRVAAQLTMVPADPALAGRIVDRLETGTLVFWPRLVAASAVVAAAVAIFAVIVGNDAREMPAIDVAQSPTADRPAPIESPSVPTAMTSAGTIATVAPTPQRPVRHRRAAIAAEPLPEMPQIDPLTSPALLAVDPLRRDMLTITPVDLAPLGLANLSVSDIDGDSPKE